MEQIKKILNDFLINKDFSTGAAGELLGKLVDYEDSVDIQDLIDILDAYQPGGGEGLFDKESLEKEIKYLLSN